MNDPISLHVPSFIAARSYCPSSARQRRQILGQFTAATGDPTPSTLHTAHVLGWWAGCSRLAPSSRQAHLSAVRSFCHHLRSIGAAESDPTEVIVRPRVHAGSPVTLSAVEVTRFLVSCPTPRDRAIVALMLGCALRSVDVSSVNVEDFDVQRRMLRVVGKGGRERQVPIPTATIECVEDYLADRPASLGPLIRHHRGHARLAPPAVQQRVTALLYAAGVKRGPWDGRSSHVLRRTCASVLLESGASIRDVQTVLGHSTIATTERYLRRPDEDRLTALIERGPLDAA